MGSSDTAQVLLHLQHMCQTAAGRSNHNSTVQMFQTWPGRQSRCDRGGCEAALLQAASSGPTLCCRQHCRAL